MKISFEDQPRFNQLNRLQGLALSIIHGESTNLQEGTLRTVRDFLIPLLDKYEFHYAAE
jgi:hypothetical protein